MKTTIKLVLSFVLLSSFALADGNQGTGGRPGNQTTTRNAPVVTVVISVIQQYLGLGV